MLRKFKRIFFGSHTPEDEVYTPEEEVVSAEFDSNHYLSTYDDVKNCGADPLIHYMRTGWREGRNPNKYFSTSSYLLCNPDVLNAGVNPFFHYISAGRSEGRLGINERDAVKKFFGLRLFDAVQDITFPSSLEKAEKVMVIVVPEHASMSGGIYSMYSIANIASRLKAQHGYEIVLMTRPNPNELTYCRQKNFRNSEDVYRFEQIERCQNVKELYLHIPEYATTDFMNFLSVSTISYLEAREKLFINILNQNTELMPEASEFEQLRELADELTQSVAHHAYFKQSFSDKYNLPTLLLPAYTDLSAYTPSTFDEKERLIIYSFDDAPHKELCLELIREELPDYKLLEIRDITFDEYMNYATQCMFSISFGEGFDGYVAQPIYQGGLGFTVYNEEFFPTKDFLDFDNFFETEEQMLNQICDKIRHYASSRQDYIDLNSTLVGEYNKLYQFDDYVKQVNKLVNRKFELIPKDRVPGAGIYRAS